MWKARTPRQLLAGTPGPFKIVDNELEAAGENVLFGGARPTLVNNIPSDIEIRGNHFFKPVSWMVASPSYGGNHWTVKNLLEFKIAQRVLITGNILENNWVDAQTGFAFLVTPRPNMGLRRGYMCRTSRSRITCCDTRRAR